MAAVDKDALAVDESRGGGGDRDIDRGGGWRSNAGIGQQQQTEQDGENKGAEKYDGWFHCSSQNFPLSSSDNKDYHN